MSKLLYVGMDVDKEKIVAAKLTQLREGQRRVRDRQRAAGGREVLRCSDQGG